MPALRASCAEDHPGRPRYLLLRRVSALDLSGSEALADFFFDLGVVGKRAGGQLRVHELVVDLDLEPPAVRGEKYQLGDLLLEPAYEMVRQTDGLRFVVSGGAVLDADPHLLSPSCRIPGRSPSSGFIGVSFAFHHGLPVSGSGH